MSSSYQSSVIQSDVNVTNITNILTQNQNVVSSTIISSQTQYINIVNVNCTEFSIVQNATITATITGQMNAQTATDITNYITSSVAASLAQSTNVITELFGVAGSNVQIAKINQNIAQFCQTNVTTQNLQSVMSTVRASQTQTVTIQNLTGSLCTIANQVTITVAAQGILSAVASQAITSTLTADISAAISQYYSAEAKGLNSLVSSAITALLLPLIIGAAVVGLIIILVVVFKLLKSKDRNATSTEAQEIGLDPNDSSGDTEAIQNKLNDNAKKASLVPVVPATPAVPVRPTIPTRPIATSTRPIMAPRTSSLSRPILPPKPAVPARLLPRSPVTSA